MKFNILTDACCDLPYQFLKEHDVAYVKMIVTLNNQEYVDDLGETLDLDWLMKQLQQGQMPTTSQINIGTYLEFFKPFINTTTPLLYLAFSSGLSGSYQNACAALKLLEEEHGKIPITIMDTKVICLAQGLLVADAIELRDQEIELSEALSILEEKAARLHAWVTVVDLKHLERGGRISKASATVGNLMNIKPIIVLNAQGKLINISKARGRKKSLERLVNQTVQGMVNPEEQTVYIAYAGDLEAAELMQVDLANKVQVKEIKVLSMGPTIASHTGYGAMAIFSYGELKK